LFLIEVQLVGKRRAAAVRGHSKKGNARGAAS
jgi:hypothetical protein